MTPLEQRANDAIAYQGLFEILDAGWSIHTGRTMDLRVISDEDRIHPFKPYRRPSQNASGARFTCCLWSDGSEEIDISEGLEVRLRAWGESYDKGQWVRFFLDHEADRHPLEGQGARLKDTPGSIIYGMFMQIDDEERVVVRQKQKPSNYAYLLSQNEMFIRYLYEKVDDRKARGHDHPKGARPAQDKWNGDLSKRYVKWRIGVESLSELDRDENARDRYRTLIYAPYMRWRGVE